MRERESLICVQKGEKSEASNWKFSSLKLDLIRALFIHLFKHTKVQIENTHAAHKTTP